VNDGENPWVNDSENPHSREWRRMIIALKSATSSFFNRSLEESRRGIFRERSGTAGIPAAIPVNSSGKDDRNCEKRRLIFQEPSSLGNSFHFSDRKPALFKIPFSFFAGSRLF